MAAFEGVEGKHWAAQEPKRLNMYSNDAIGTRNVSFCLFNITSRKLRVKILINNLHAYIYPAINPEAIVNIAHVSFIAGDNQPRLTRI